MRIYRRNFDQPRNNLEDKALHGIYSFEKLFDVFCEMKTAQGRSAATVNHYRRSFKLLIDFLNEKGIRKDVRNVKTEHLRQFINWMITERKRHLDHKYKPESAKNKPLSKRTAYGYIKNIKSFYRFLVDESYIHENPTELIDNVKYVDKDIEIMTADEVRALLSVPNIRRYADFRDFVIMHLLLDSICRIGEALSLKRSDVDIQGRTVYFRGANTKSKKPRLVPIKTKTARLIKELIEETDDFETDYIFLVNYGEPMSTERFRKRLNIFADKAGLKRSINPHLFRHTGATMFLEAGGDIRHLQMILGHSDMRMVQRYTHLTTKSILNQHEEFSPLNTVETKLQKERKILR